MPTTYATEAIATIVVSSVHKAPELIFPYALFVAISVGAQHSVGGGTHSNYPELSAGDLRKEGETGSLSVF